MQEGTKCWRPLHYWVSSLFQVSCFLLSYSPVYSWTTQRIVSKAPHTSCPDLHLDRKEKEKSALFGINRLIRNLNLQMSGQSAAKTHTLISPRQGKCKAYPDPAWKSRAPSHTQKHLRSLTATGLPECGLKATLDLATIETMWSSTAVGRWTHTRWSSRETWVRETAPLCSPI